MKRRAFGRTGRRVSEVGFGAWGIGKTWWGSTEDAESLRALRRALDLGIDFFDTAYVYGDGHSEELIASALKGKSASAFVATKVPPKNMGWPADPRTPLEKAFPEDWVTACTERSLRLLKTDCLDLQQLHVWTDAWLEQEEWRRAAERLKRVGKIRAFGVSVNDCDPESALRLVAAGGVDSVQVIYNIFEVGPARALFPLCKATGTAVIVRVPLDEGSLTGSLTPGTRFEEGDFRADYFRGQRLAQTCARVERLGPLLGGHARTVAELALKFVLAHPDISTVIPGMRSVRHVEANAALSDSVPLPPEVLEALAGHAWKRNFYK